jgi:tetratricopeptide (TPR) repeat protein
MRRSFLLLIALALALPPARASADEPSDALAKQRFAAAAQAYREARYRDAIAGFLEANRLDPHPELVFNVGQSYEKLGDVANALRWYREYLRLAPGVVDRATIEASIRNLEARLRERGVQQVSIFSAPSGASLLLDDKPVGSTPWTGEITPGRHVAVLRASGYPDTAKEFVLTTDRAMDLDIALARVAMGTGATALVPKATEPAEPAKKKGVAPWTIAALGVGVAGLGAALGLEIARRGAESDAKADPTQIGYHDKLASLSTRQTAARVLVGVGAAATAAGGVLLVLDLRGGSSAPAKTGIGCLDGACGAFVAGRF